ncbi:MAG: tRNA glutamyl-Q(34) synthetase GluQRS, partial [Hyphomicrobiales bacterium]|nr:tRNA glutamyl-Q(34) synthetase GluQRS [Hyphomicrobiales bacterium]
MTAAAPVRLRFAPTPNGRLHLGHAYSALFNERLARAPGGTLLLRIEDIDATRAREVHVEAIREDLAWLGVRFDGEAPRQSARLDVYARSLAALDGRGLLYRCFCTRADLRARAAAAPDGPRDPDGAPVAPCRCKAMPRAEIEDRAGAGASFAWRLDMARAIEAAPGDLAIEEWGEGDRPAVLRARPEIWGDAVLARKDAPGGYHLCVVVDDADQSITDVARGADLREATHLHRLLQALLGLPAPRWRHHRLVRG